VLPLVRREVRQVVRLVQLLAERLVVPQARVLARVQALERELGLQPVDLRVVPRVERRVRVQAPPVVNRWMTVGKSQRPKERRVVPNHSMRVVRLKLEVLNRREANQLMRVVARVQPEVSKSNSQLNLVQEQLKVARPVVRQDRHLVARPVAELEVRRVDPLVDHRVLARVVRAASLSMTAMRVMLQKMEASAVCSRSVIR
jgi:hypothetical protein